jgi:hypothetical protein
MMERKDIIIRLLEYVLKYEPVKRLTRKFLRKIFRSFFCRVILSDKKWLMQLNLLLMFIIPMRSI